MNKDNLGNKCNSIYFEYHSRNSMCWKRCENPIIICDVISDEKYVKKYRSEIYSPIWNSEYVVKMMLLICCKNDALIFF